MTHACEGQSSRPDGGSASPAVEEHVVLGPPSSSSESSLSSKSIELPQTQKSSIGNPDAQPSSSKHCDKSAVPISSPNLEPHVPSLSHRPSHTFSSQMDRRRPRRVPADDTEEANETVPIIGWEQGGGQDYQSISPRIRAKTSNSNNGTQRERQEREAEQAAVAAEAKEGKWWKTVIEKYGSVELENKGSVARDHLALERTFLAWLRTSLSFASIGIAITQLFRLNTTIAAGKSGQGVSPMESPRAKLRHVGKPLGATFIAISILILFIGFHRYFESQHYVIRGKFPASRGSIVMVSAVAGALIITSLVVILAVAPSAFEK